MSHIHIPGVPDEAAFETANPSTAILIAPAFFIAITLTYRCSLGKKLTARLAARLAVHIRPRQRSGFTRAVYLIAGGIPYLVLLFLFAALMNHLFAQPDKIGPLYLIVSLLYSIPLFFAQILIAGVSSVVHSADASAPPEDDPPEG